MYKFCEQFNCYYKIGQYEYYYLDQHNKATCEECAKKLNLPHHWRVN